MPKADQFPDALVRALRMLAQPAQVQRRLHPDFVWVGDDMADEFDIALKELDPDEREALPGLDRIVALMDQNTRIAERWTTEAVETLAFWQDIRSAARAVLAAAGLEDGPVRGNAAIYVAGRSKC